MPITPPQGVKDLLDVYDDLVQGATDLTGAAAAIAPAAVRDVICQVGGLASLLGGPLGPLQGPGSRDRQASDLGGILQAACPVPPAPPVLTPTVGPPPFTGGQCACAFYSVNYSLVRANPPQTLVGTLVRRGPIGSPIQGGVVPGSPDRKSWGFFYGDASCGARLFELLASTGPTGSSGDFTLSITGVALQSGMPDDCGDPPGPETPAPPIPPIPDLPASPVIPPAVPDPGVPGGGGYVFKPRVGPIEIGPGGGITVPVVINIGGPSLNIPVTIPVNVGLPDFSPTVIIGGSGGGGGVGPGSGGDGPPQSPEPICCRPKPVFSEEEEGEEGEPVEGEEPPFRGRLVGVVVRSTLEEERLSATEVGQGGGAKNLWVPRLGNIYFQVTGKDSRGLTVASSTQEMPVKLLDQYIPAPPDVAVASFRAVPEPGVKMSVRAVVVPANPSP